MRFDSWQEAVLWAYAQLESPIKAQVYDRETFGKPTCGKGDAYHDAMEIKSQVEEAAKRFMAEDRRGNWIYLHVWPSPERVFFRRWERRRIDNAVDNLKYTLEYTGYLIR